MKTIYCPACGQLCISAVDTAQAPATGELVCVCPAGHQWSVLLSFTAQSDDGTSIIGFQCDGTSAYSLPELWDAGH